MRTRVLNSQLRVSRPREEVFSFFTDIRNLDAITPPWLRFRILTPDVKLDKGAFLEYQLRIRGIPVRWQTEITVWEPPTRFVDEQRMGPYKRWIHEHRFLQDSGGTLILDHVEYGIPGWILEPWVFHFLVGPDLEKVFEYRREWLNTYFKSPRETPWASL
ncbi:MAG TPA: SRPBCC family protein [Acidobacteriota bacterium]|nr:SRPBCC family protein [Acidobacteriota bacterium]